MFYRWIKIFFLILIYTQVNAEYKISGKLNMNGDWQQTIYLATIDKLDDYHKTSSSQIVATAPINLDGSFVLVGKNLPNERQFYRLYVIKEEHSEYNACLFQGGDEHNFIHVILDNSSNLQITADKNTYSPFGDYMIIGDLGNKLLKEVSDIVYPSYQFYEIKFPSELEFAEKKLNQDLFSYADTCKIDLVRLAAILHTNFDDYILSNSRNYLDVYATMIKFKPSHAYTVDFERKLKYYGLLGADEGFNYWKWLSFLLLGILGFFGFQYVKLKKHILSDSDINDISFLDQLTSQEKKILTYIADGKSNKEIASELFIEVSTVKSHINKLYSKINVSNRYEAQKFAKNTLK